MSDRRITKQLVNRYLQTVLAVVAAGCVSTPPVPAVAASATTVAAGVGAAAVSLL